MSAHTPGPWIADDAIDGTWVVLAGEIGVDETVVAEVVSRNVCADARLIAAAPRMLEVLKGCLGYFEDMENAGVNAAHYMPDDAWLAPIRAILRDVEGKA